VIIRHLNVDCAIFGPDKTDSELIVDPNRMLPSPIAAQRFETIAGRRPQIVEIDRSMEVAKLAPGNCQDVGWNTLPSFTIEDGFSPSILEAFDHEPKCIIS
jgi:hypothetical protein